MQASCCDQPPKWAYLNPTTLTWTNFQGNGKFDVFDEEGWNLLPNGKILTVDAYVFQYDPIGHEFGIVRSCQPRAGRPLVARSFRSGTAHCGNPTPRQPLRWDRRCCGQMARYLRPAPPTAVAPVTPPSSTASTGTWTAGPDFPDVNVSIADGPASIEPNGNVLMMGSPNEGPPSTFYEWDGTNLTSIPGPPNGPVDGSFYGHLLPLPTGQILFTDWSCPPSSD